MSGGGRSLGGYCLSSLNPWGNGGPERPSDPPTGPQPVTAGL